MYNIPEIDHSRESAIHFFLAYIKANGNDLRGKNVCDLSAGRGYIARLFEEVGAHVFAYDLFPEQNKFLLSPVEKIDLQKKIPIANDVMDLVICCETIEHLPNQYLFFQEVARIIKPNGVFILTTPNTSSLRSRFSQFMMESEHYGAPAPNEHNAITYWPNSKEGYFSKIFLSGVLRLRTLAALHQLRLIKIHPSPRSSTSYWLMPLFFPALYYFSRKVMKRQIKNDPSNEETYRTIFAINTSTDVLLGKHLVMEFFKM